MIKQSTYRRLGRHLATWGTAGVLMTHSCSPTDLNNLLGTIEAVANALVTPEEDEVTFLNYLIDELND